MAVTCDAVPSAVREELSGRPFGWYRGSLGLLRGSRLGGSLEVLLGHVGALSGSLGLGG